MLNDVSRNFCQALPGGAGSGSENVLSSPPFAVAAAAAAAFAAAVDVAAATASASVASASARVRRHAGDAGGDSPPSPDTSPATAVLQSPFGHQAAPAPAPASPLPP
jgi:hypothetical protein